VNHLANEETTVVEFRSKRQIRAKNAGFYAKPSLTGLPENRTSTDAVMGGFQAHPSLITVRRRNTTATGQRQINQSHTKRIITICLT